MNYNELKNSYYDLADEGQDTEENIKKLLEKEGLGLKNVIRTRMFVTDISKWEEYGKAHGEFFRDIKPVATMVEVSSLIDKELMIEIEVSAVVD